MASQLVWFCVAALVCCLANLAHTAPFETVTAHNPLPVPMATDASSTLDTILPTKGTEVTSATETSKMSRFLDDFTSAFKQGTAKMKESLENAASSVKDGVLQGYDYVRSKLTGTGTELSTPGTPSVEEEAEEEEQKGSHGNSAGATSTAAALTSVTPSTERPAISAATGLSSTDTKDGLTVLGGVVGVSNEPARIVPNDDDDDERIFFNDKDYTAVKPLDGSEDERDVTESPVTTTVAVDNRFIIAGPLACKSGQEVVNGKCRNVF